MSTGSEHFLELGGHYNKDNKCIISAIRGREKFSWTIRDSRKFLSSMVSQIMIFDYDRGGGGGEEEGN